MGIPKPLGRALRAKACPPPSAASSSVTCCGRHNQGARLPGVPGVPGAPGLEPCAALSPAALDLARRRAARARRRHSSFERNQI